MSPPAVSASAWISRTTHRSHLSRLELQEGIAKYLASKIAELPIERHAIEFEKADFQLSETKPFSWRRNLPPPGRRLGHV